MMVLPGPAGNFVLVRVPILWIGSLLWKYFCEAVMMAVMMAAMVRHTRTRGFSSHHGHMVMVKVVAMMVMVVVVVVVDLWW